MNDYSLYNAIRNAHRPWSTANAQYAGNYCIVRKQNVTDQRDIDECLECPKPECTNCKRYSSNRYGYVTKVG